MLRLSEAKGAYMPGKNYRSAKTGKFVTKKYAKSHPATTVGERRGGGKTGSARSAQSGRFVTGRFARSHPTTTVKED